MPTLAEKLLTALKERSDIEPLLEQMLAANEYANARDEDGMSAHNIVTHTGLSFDIIGKIRAHNSNINMKRHETIPADFYEAVMSLDWGRVTAYGYIPEQGHDVDYLLYEVIDHDASPTFVDNLIELTGANVNGTGINGEPIIYAAARPARLDILRVLIRRDADPHTPGYLHTSILHPLPFLEPNRKDHEYLRYAIEELGIDLDLPDHDTNTFMHNCTKLRKDDICQFVLPYAPDVTIKNREQQSVEDLELIPDQVASQEHIKRIKKLKSAEEELEHELESGGNDRISYVQLPNLDLDGHTIPWLAKIFKKTNPMNVDLSNNLFTDGDLEKLTRLFIQFPSIITVNLIGNDLSDATQAEIEKIISLESRMQQVINSHEDAHEKNIDFDLAITLLKKSVDKTWLKTNPQTIDQESGVTEKYKVTKKIREVKTGEDKLTIFHLAAQYNCTEIINLSAREDILRTSKNDFNNVFHYALYLNHEKLCTRILQRCPEALKPVEILRDKTVFVTGEHPLIYAVKNNMCDLVSHILFEIEPNIKKIHGADKLLQEAARLSLDEMVTILIRAGFQLTETECAALVEELDELPKSKKIEKIKSEITNPLTTLKDFIEKMKTWAIPTLRKDLRQNNIDPNSSLDGERSLLQLALDDGNLQCAGMLIAEGAIKGDNEAAAINALSHEDKVTLRNESLKYFSRDPEAIIKYFESRVRFVGGRYGLSKTRKKKLDKLFNWILGEDANEVVTEMLMPILEVIEYSPMKVDIILDFNNDSVERMNPLQSNTTRGAVMHKEGKIYIGAERETHGIRGTLMHELCHLAMELVFKNECNPYFKGDTSYKDLQKDLLSKKNNLLKSVLAAVSKKDGESMAEALYEELLKYIQTSTSEKSKIQSHVDSQQHSKETEAAPDLKKIPPIKPEDLRLIVSKVIEKFESDHDNTKIIYQDKITEKVSALQDYFQALKEEVTASKEESTTAKKGGAAEKEGGASEKEEVTSAKEGDAAEKKEDTEKTNLYDIIRRALTRKGVEPSDRPALFISQIINAIIADNGQTDDKVLYTVIRKVLMEYDVEIRIAEFISQIAYGIQELGQTEENKLYTRLKKELCYQEENLHDIIQRAFTLYKTEDHASELIVRVPHLFAECGLDAASILMDQALLLYRFYREFVLPQMAKYIHEQKLRCFSIQIKNAGLGVPDTDIDTDPTAGELLRSFLSLLIQTEKAGLDAPETDPAAGEAGLGLLDTDTDLAAGAPRNLHEISFLTQYSGGGGSKEEARSLPEAGW